MHEFVQSNECEVIDRLVKRVPRLKERLAYIRRILPYQPPELLPGWWRGVVSMLEQIPDITPEEDAHIRAVLERDEP